ncbi:MAG: hypothetical protein ACQKBU_02510, partial [Verrucomicrobiales bacterium]
LYNGNGGGVYGSAHALDSFTEGEVTTAGYRVFSKLIAGIQNGSQDGMALVVGDEVTEFVSYEGSFEATDGPAMGMHSVDVGAEQTPPVEAGLNSIGRVGEGSRGEDFTWVRLEGSPHSGGAVNQDQTLILPGAPAQGFGIDSVTLTFLEDADRDGFANDEDPDDDNDGMSDVDELVFGSDPLDATSTFVTRFSRSVNGTEMTFPGFSGIRYEVERSDDLLSWDPFSSHVGEGVLISVSLPVSEIRTFFRVRVEE